MKTDCNPKIPKRAAIPVLIICGIILIIVLIMYKSVYYINASEKFLATALIANPPEIGLSAEEKKEDFLYLYETMKKNAPVASIKVNGKSFIDNKDIFLSAVVDTESDYEFYCVMYSLMSSVPSCHTSFFSQFDLETIKNSSYCYNSSKALSHKGLTEKVSYWHNQNTDMMDEIDISARLEFKYVEGKYLFSDIYPETKNIYTGYRLISINNINIDEYASTVIAPSSIMYDSINEKWFRPTLGFNTAYGDKVILEIESPEGEKIKINAFYDIIYENSYIDKMIALKQNNEVSQICYSIDISEDTAYITIDNFMDPSLLTLSGKLNNSQGIKNVIVDLRENSGGFIEYAEQYLYPILYTDNIDANNTLYIKCSRDLNKLNNMNDMIRLWDSKIEIINDTECNGIYYLKNKNSKYVGMASEERNIYILIGRNSFSAADNFAADMKEAANTVIIGNNSGGEGMIDGYVMDVLPNSGLLFTYNPAYSLNSNGTNNSVYGTSPDIYSELSVENYITQQEFIKNGEDPYTYENRLKWDNVLIETLEIIEEKENTK